MKKYLALGAILVLALVVLVFDIYKRRELAKADAAVAESAKEVGAVRAQLVSAQQLIAELQKSKIAGVGKIIKAGAVPTTRATVTAAITDTAKGTEKTEAGSPCPIEWSDEYHRFTVDLSTGLLTRQQLFTMELVILRSPSGEKKYTLAELREYDPVTHAEIPRKGINIGIKTEINDEKPPGPSRWHLYGVAVVDYRGAFGVGTYVEPFQHVTVGFLGLYSAKDKDFRAAAFAGYRPWDWTVSFGPYLGISTHAGTLVGGVAATIQVTR